MPKLATGKLDDVSKTIQVHFPWLFLSTLQIILLFDSVQYCFKKCEANNKLSWHQPIGNFDKKRSQSSSAISGVTPNRALKWRKCFFWPRPQKTYRTARLKQSGASLEISFQLNLVILRLKYTLANTVCNETSFSTLHVLFFNISYVQTNCVFRICKTNSKLLIISNSQTFRNVSLMPT